MKILLEHLRTFTALPDDPRDARELLDDVGIEVKTVDHTALGTVFNVELLANRGDHYCYYGIAREVRGRTGGALQMPPLRRLDAVSAPESRILIETPLCLVYTLTEIDAGQIAALPPEVLAPMLAGDMHSTLPAVDASNLTNLDIGQPTHAFDADTIEGPITIRLSRAGEKAWMLFTPEPVEVPAGTLVIADDVKILGIAGVIGCEESAVRETTRRIVLESACFDPTAVRIASRQLNQATDAAARFMRGGDPTLPLAGAARVAQLLEQHSGYRIGQALVAGDWTDPRRVIEIHPEPMKRFIGSELSSREMTERLQRYGFEVEGTKVVVPPHRLWDVHFEADLAEELLKSLGYNETVVTLPHVTMGALPSHEEDVMTRVSEVLVAEGFYEIFTDSFYSRRTREQLGIAGNEPLFAHVETQNAIERDYSLLRNNTVAQALETLATNINLRTPNIKAYEWARIFLPDPAAENGVCSERAVLWLLANGRDRGPFWADRGRPADAIYLKGIVEQLRYELRLDIDTASSEGHRLERFLHPGRRAGIRINGMLAGILGEIHPSLLQRYDIKRQRPVYLEIDTAALLAAPLPRTYAEPPARQPILRNVAYAIPSGIPAAEVRNTLAASGPPYLREIRMVDVYELPGDARQTRAVTFEIDYLPDEAITGEAVNAATERMMAAVSERFGETVALRG